MSKENSLGFVICLNLLGVKANLPMATKSIFNLIENSLHLIELMKRGVHLPFVEVALLFKNIYKYDH